MNLEEQFKVILYSFSYGMILFFMYKLFKMIIFKKKLLKYIYQLIFCTLNVVLFYFLLYKINNGILNFYIFLFLLLGVFFCKVFYFDKEKH